METDTADDDRLTPNRSVFSQEEMGSGSQNTLDGVLTGKNFTFFDNAAALYLRFICTCRYDNCFVFVSLLV